MEHLNDIEGNGIESLIELRGCALKKCLRAAVVVGIGLLGIPFSGWALDALFHIPDDAVSAINIVEVGIRLAFGLFGVIGAYWLCVGSLMCLRYSAQIRELEARHRKAKRKI